jgi:hypothetical protein
MTWAVSCCFLILDALIQSQNISCRSCEGQRGMGAGFCLSNLVFYLLTIIPPVCLTRLSSGSGTRGLSEAAVAKNWNGKCEARRPPGRFRHKWQADTEVGFKKNGMLEGCELRSWFQIEKNAGWCEVGMSNNNLLGSINCGQFLDYLINW